MKRSLDDLRGNQLLAGALAGRPPTWGRILLFILSLEVVLLVVGGLLSIPITIALMVPALQSGQFQLTEGAVLQMLDMMNRTLPGLLVNLLQFLLMAGWTFLWVRVVEGRPLASLGLQNNRLIRQWARGMLVGAGLLVFSVALIPLRGGLSILAVTPAGVGKTIFWLCITLLFFLLQGPAEELVARGYLLQAFSAKAGVAAGIVLSSLVFALQHALNPNLTPLALANLFLYAVFAALYALRDESLWGVFGLHSAWNWTQGNVLGLPVSGSGFGQAPLFHLQTAGPGWWTGGAFGPEGGLTVTLSTLLGIIVLLVLMRRCAPAASSRSIPAEGGNPGDTDVEP
jgi:membrane protease YdiL (CAAX protease family)